MLLILKGNTFSVFIRYLDWGAEGSKVKFGHPKIQGLVKKSPYSLSNSHPVPSETSYGLQISKHTTQIHS